MDAHAIECRPSDREAIGGVTTLVPGFVVGFLGMAILRSIGDATLASSGAAFGVLQCRVVGVDSRRTSEISGPRKSCSAPRWRQSGLNTNFAVFKGVGLKPFVVGMAGALVVGAVGMAMAVLLGRFVHL